ncbi:MULTISPECIES: hypothetical protein [unclassified Streptomyces]|uniref:WXG100-like domain-containing protein n=1 Tax=unclassified Streptomyces TaxID=2593676 RepID=UPI000DB9C410|nr:MULTISPECIES: hypothetical protein [unclassified Streptomyces]MYT73298.1 hypothetical protein [Streptomyces sp. SID8367]RAJ74898.1 hypothetical protein K377_06665 [Streptomyces sp. PsTaAH-137]
MAWDEITVLPPELDWILDLLGFDWPNLNEVKMIEAANEWLRLGQAAADAQTQGNAAAQPITAFSGEAVEKFTDEWGKFAGGALGVGYLDVISVASGALAGALTACAAIVAEMKLAIIIQLIDLAIEFAAAQASAVFTLGASEAAFAARVVMVRQLVGRLLKEAAQKVWQAIQEALKERVVKEAKTILEDLAKDTLKSVASEAATQSIKVSLGAGGGLQESLLGFGAAAVNPAMGKVAGEISVNDDGNGYDFEAKAGGKVVQGLAAADAGDPGGLRTAVQGAGELFNNATEKPHAESGTSTPSTPSEPTAAPSTPTSDTPSTPTSAPASAPEPAAVSAGASEADQVRATFG